MLVDSEFKLHGVSAYKWVTLNLMGVTFEMTYGKRLLQGAVMKSDASLKLDVLNRTV